MDEGLKSFKEQDVTICFTAKIVENKYGIRKMSSFNIYINGCHNELIECLAGAISDDRTPFGEIIDDAIDLAYQEKIKQQ
jgi:hypothetical protein